MAREAVGEGVEGKSYWGMAARECDSCRVSRALLFCRADSAFLCGGCDAKVHGANRLASRHERVWMCEVCEEAPAAVTCKADAAALCVSCDADIHSANPLARRHERLPVSPFYDSPGAPPPKPGAPAPDVLLLDPCDDDEGGDDGSEEAEAASWLLPNPNPGAATHHQHSHPKVPMEAPELKDGDYFLSDVDPYLDLEYACSMDSRVQQADRVVPVQPKAAASAVHPPPFFASDGFIDFDFGRSKPSSGTYSMAPSLSHSLSSSEVGVVPDVSAMADVSNPYAGVGGPPAPAPAALGMDRKARVMRYREKRKNRRFEKTIRYASRKAYAETRPRVKGRFAKRPDTVAKVDRFYSAAAALLADPGYGLVPSF
uniref:Zinc finger protein CONSTANS-LIKE 4 n=1 Tax=Anthurium amnicola TaxID=1678845 RepID=A0A1D1ZJJ7_9ARAE